ncbi:MAG: MarR family transcriptional regulator [Burkholderiaceae bacterium]
METRYARAHDLTLPTWRSLAVIARFGPLSAGELRAKTSSDAFRVARAIDLLVGRGLVSRESDPSDRRRAQLKLTAAGSALYEELEVGSMQIEETLRARLTEHDIRTLDDLLTRIESEVLALADHR